MNAVSSLLNTQSLKSVEDPAIVKKDHPYQLKETKWWGVVVKVDYKIRSDGPPSYKCSYQSQIGAKPIWQSNLLRNCCKIFRFF